MGRSRRPRPKYLGRKLKTIRESLGLTVVQLAERLDYPHPAHISGFERGDREPSYLVLLGYAKLSGVSTDVLIDDQLELPLMPCKSLGRVSKRLRR
jgi:transcriptional regulator with XRE-family HTH domain